MRRVLVLGGYGAFVAGQARQRQTKDQRRDYRDLVRLENVGRHTGAVADIIADQVSYHSGVARIVLRNPSFDLAYQVGAHVRCLGINAAADAH